MRFGLSFYNLAAWADPRNVVRLAEVAEQAGWDGLFPADHLGFVWDGPAADPWVLLSAAAMVTKHMRLGTVVTPLPRRRPHVVAHTVATLDVLTRGRMILGVGLGGRESGTRELVAFGEPGDMAHRAELLDEALEVITALWSGQRVEHLGRHYRVDGVTLAPRPVQRPRVPIWVGGDSRPALRRAARFDGWVPEGTISTPEALAEKVAVIREHRAGDSPFDVVIRGCSEPGDRPALHAYEEVGATWWIEEVSAAVERKDVKWSLRGSLAEMLDRVAAGPPR